MSAANAMALSKNVVHCRRCLLTQIRPYSGNSNAVDPTKMSARSVSLSHWRILSQLKEYLSKASADQSFQSMLDKEFARLLQKLRPSVYGASLFRGLNNKNKEQSVADNGNVVKSVAAVEEVEATSGGMTIPNVLNGLGISFGSKEGRSEGDVKKKEVSKKEEKAVWKSDKNTISKSSISSRTRHVIYSIGRAESGESKLRRVEELSSHIRQFPGEKHYAVKEGAIRLLLRVRRQQSENSQLRAAIAEALTILGHVDPLPNKGIRILSIDGGGIRGLLVIEMLKKLEELTGKRVHEMFDFICGVSTGAILACSLGILQKDLETLQRDYKELSTRVFTQSTIKGTSSLVWSHSYYDTSLWEQLLKENLSEANLIATSRNPLATKVACVSTVVNHERVSAYVFRNYSLPWRVCSQYMGGYEYEVWQAARASAAAPTYFEEFKLGNFLHQDGGILVNNPTAVAIHEAKLLWPESPIQCVVSFGTGRTVPNQFGSDDVKLQPEKVSSWKNKFMKILDSATDTEAVNMTLGDLLPENVYYRFNPYLTEMLSMVEIEPGKLEQLERDATMYLRRNEDKFRRAAKAISEKRTVGQKVADWVNFKKDMLGLGSF